MRPFTRSSRHRVAAYVLLRAAAFRPATRRASPASPRSAQGRRALRDARSLDRSSPRRRPPAADLPVADGRAARGRRLRVAGPRGPRARRPAGPRPGRRAARATSPSSSGGGRSTPRPTSSPPRWCRSTTPRSARCADGLTLAEIPLRDRLRELDFEIPLAGGDTPRPARRRTAARPRPGAAAHLAGGRPDADLRRPAARARRSATSRCAATSPARSTSCCGCRGPRFVVVDYKTNWLGEVRAAAHAADYTPDRAAPRRCCTPTTRCRRCSTPSSCTATCAGASPATTPSVHLGGVLYLYVRGMCGPDTPVVDGSPCGVFTLAAARGAGRSTLSDLLDGEEGA